MFGSEVLEVGIGMVLLFLFISLIASAVREGLEGLLKHRAASLKRGLQEMFTDDAKLQEFYQHPLICALFKGHYNASRTGNLPSYIPTKNFVAAITSLVARSPDGVAAGAPPLSLDSLRTTVGTLPDSNLKKGCLAALDAAQGDLAKFSSNLETWFDGTMDRVSGWYKRKTQLILFLIGIGAAVILNIDALTIMQRLSQDKALRSVAVAQAERISSPGNGGSGLPAPLQDANLEELRKQIVEIGFPVGWALTDRPLWIRPAPQSCNRQPNGSCVYDGLTPGKFLLMLIGWLITACAVMPGAPLWFDVLNKFMVIRSTVKPYEKSPPEGSEDRQFPKPATVRVEVANAPG